MYDKKNKGAFVERHLRSLGFETETVDGVFRVLGVPADVDVQQIIDDYDPLEDAQIDAIERVNEIAEKAQSQLVGAYPAQRRVLDRQAQAARDRSSRTSALIARVSERSGRTIRQIADDIEQKAGELEELEAEIEAARYTTVLEIQSLVDFTQCSPLVRAFALEIKDIQAPSPASGAPSPIRQTIR